MPKKKENKQQNPPDKTQKDPPKSEDPENDKSKRASRLRNAKGQFVPGHDKLGGRQLGTKNKSSMRERLREQIEPLVDQVLLNLMKVQKEEGTAAMLALQEKFMPYFMPKYSAIQLGDEQDRPLSEEQALMELDAKYKKKEMNINIQSLTIVHNDIITDDDDDFDPDNDPDFQLPV